MGKPDDTITAISATDGRRKRGDQSRKRIVQALMDLIREGEMSPSAVQVAERADVGLRTVFRHFEDMETLYREIAEVVRPHVLHALSQPYASPSWRGQLDELIERRIEVYEHIMPLKVAGSILRFRSPFLMQDYNDHLRFARKTLKQILPAWVTEDRDLFRALEMVTSFQAWRRLRQDQGLAIPDATRILHRLVAGLLPKAGDDSAS